MTVAIIGSGMAGMSAAHGLRLAGIESVVYEKSSSWGGHTSSDVFEGCTFDEGPHVSFTKDERIERFFANSVDSWEEISARIFNYYEGRWIAHPAQVNLHGLDADLVTRCITDLVEAHRSPPAVNNYADWLVAMYGKTFAENFPFKYTRKYWTVEPHQLGIDWVGGRMHQSDLTQMVRGAVAPQERNDFHYISKYRYPTTGGYQSYMRTMSEGANVVLKSDVVSVDVKDKVLTFADGRREHYDDLVSTMPLDRLVKRITGVAVPPAVLEAADALLCSSVVLVDVVANQDDAAIEADWFYVYDEDLSMSRVYLPKRLAPGNTPEGVTALQAEVYFSKHKPLETPLVQLNQRVVDEFQEMGLIEKSRVQGVRHRVLEYANIVFDHDRAAALEVIMPFVESCGIRLAGRYGQWGYLWTDDVVNAGWSAASEISGIPVEELLSTV